LRFYPNPNFSPDFKGIDSIPSSTTLRILLLILKALTLPF